MAAGLRPDLLLAELERSSRTPGRKTGGLLLRGGEGRDRKGIGWDEKGEDWRGGKWREHERRGGGGKGGERREKRGREGEGKTEGDGPVTFMSEVKSEYRNL